MRILLLPTATIFLLVLWYTRLSPEEWQHITGKDSFVFWFGLPSLLVFFVAAPILVWLDDRRTKSRW